MRIKISKRALAIYTPIAVILLLIAISVIRRVAAADTEEVEFEGVAVLIGSPEVRSIEEILRYPGTLVPQQTITAVAKVTGRVDRIHVSEGNAVVPGTLLVTIDAESVSLQADQAYAAWQAAEAQYRKAERGVRDAELDNARASFAQAEEEFSVTERNLERSKRLFEAGTISRSQFEEAENAQRAASTAIDNARRSLQMMEDGASTEDLDSAKANAEAHEAQYELAALQQTDALVRSPSYGTVARILVDPGNLVSTGTPLVAVVSGTIFARIEIPEKYYGRFAANRTEIEVRAFPVAYTEDAGRSGGVATVAPTIDPESRTFIVEAALANRDGKLKPGMYVNTEIVIARRDSALVVPESAVVVRNDAQVVFAAISGNSEHAEERNVILGLRSDGYVEILDGLDPADRIVFDGNAFLEDGQRLRVIVE